MNKRTLGTLLLLFLALGCFWFYLEFSENSTLEEANKAYQKGELAKTREERFKYFNRSLELYKQLEDRYNPVLGDGKLYYNIANNFFQLSQYSFAVLYYYKALALRPGDEQLQQNLNRALQKLELKPESASSSLVKQVMAHDLPIPFRLQLFALFTILTFAFLSIYLWKGNGLYKNLGRLSTVFLVLITISIVYSAYIAPIEGVILHATALYPAPSSQYSKIGDKLIPSGQKVTVIEVKKGSEWVKISGPEEVFGYVPIDAIELI